MRAIVVTEFGLVLIFSTVFLVVAALSAANSPNMFGFDNPTGTARSFVVNGAVDTSNPFFQSLGTNGRSCGSCHDAADGWTIVPSHAGAIRGDRRPGSDLFRTNDGSNSPLADVSTVQARQARVQHAALPGPDSRRHRRAG
jgi:hypothetical protein